MITIGLVGLGFIGTTHLKAYESIANARVKSICSRNEDTATALARQHNTSYVTDFEQLLNDPDIDIIDICVPTHLHESFIIRTAQARKHIICEKPLTLTTKAAERVLEAVRANDVRLFVGHVVRFWPEYDLIASYSRQDQLKAIDTVHAQRLGQAPAWSEWFKYPEKSGGALFDLHIHDIDFVYLLLGNIHSVYAVGQCNQYGAWDHVMTTLTFENGSYAFVEASHRMPENFPFTMSLRAQAPAGTLDFQLKAGANIENADNTSKLFTYISSEGTTSLEVNTNTDPFVAELSYFINCLKKNRDNTAVPLSDVLYTLAVMEAIEQSLTTGAIVDMSPPT